MKSSAHTMNQAFPKAIPLLGHPRTFCLWMFPNFHPLFFHPFSYP